MHKELYEQLVAAFTSENLNYITTSIIEAYRNKRYGLLEKLVRGLKEHYTFPESKINKYFSRLIMLYHPDKINYYKNELESFATKRDDSILAALSHIQITMDILQSKSEPNMMDSHIMDGFEIEFGFDDEDFEDINNWNVYDLDGNIEKSADRINQYNDFFTLLKIQEFGHTDTHIPVSELQNLDGKIELTGVQMDDLSGIEYCVNIQVVDFSDNHLTEITKLGYLNDLRELDLSQNNIDDISALSGLLQLESLDLAFNNIDNISKLFDLPALKYLNLIGNPVPIHQIEEIKKRSCMVVF